MAQRIASKHFHLLRLLDNLLDKIHAPPSSILFCLSKEMPKLSLRFIFFSKNGLKISLQGKNIALKTTSRIPVQIRKNTDPIRLFTDR